MAKVTSHGSGQGRVRHYKQGRMTRCLGEKNFKRCYKMIRIWDLTKEYSAETLAWKCDSCKIGKDPFIPKNVRVGQQKQSTLSR